MMDSLVATFVEDRIKAPGIRFIQVKARKHKEKGKWGISRKELRELAANVPSNCSVELWVIVDRAKEWHKEVIE